MTNRELMDESRDKLLTDFRAVIADAEDYLAASVGQAGEAYAAARRKLERRLDAARAQATEAQHVLSGKTRAAARAADGYVHENPWQIIAVAASAGLLAGLLIGRR
ncbi:MAG: DUF883 family protein [Acidobacteria bacterium]|nr:MAG: DUF883 family protein [Acidobacteriota bacterium]